MRNKLDSELNAITFFGALTLTIIVSFHSCHKAEMARVEAQTINVPVTSIEMPDIEIIYAHPVEEVLTIEVETEEFAPYEFISLRDELQIYMETLCADMDLDYFLCAALMESESTFREDVTSKDGKDIGLFQIRASVWEKHFKERGLDIYDSKDNIECGLIIIKDLLDKYPVETALQCYKCGETKGLQLLEEGTVIKSVQYILERWEEYKDLSCEVNR